MMEKVVFNTFVLGWIFLACVIFLFLLFITAPYGRHSSKKWGLTIPNKVGWVLMEIPVLLIFLYFYLNGKANKNITTWLIVILFAIHYIHRSMVYPFRIKTRGKQMPLLIALLAVFFNTVNGFVNGYFLGTLQTQYTPEWLKDPRFVTGVIVFFAGMIINVNADEKLIHMRKSSSNGYQVPYGGLFNKISCPNFFGEIIEWAGFAVLCWSLPALSFFIWTCCNLVPRALDHHKWYKGKFENYPEERKAVFPYIL